LELFGVNFYGDGPSQNSPEVDSVDALSGILVVSIEQAVAAPYTTSRLAEAGARV